MKFWPFQNNYSFVAENATKYYVELNSRYKNRFKDEICLLATSGVLDAQNYVFASPPRINIEDIVHLAKESTNLDKSHVPIRRLISSEKATQGFFQGKKSGTDVFLDYIVHSENEFDCPDELFDFVFGIELLIFGVDTGYSSTTIREACSKEINTIEKAIVKTIKGYKVGKGIFAQSTTAFMDSKIYQSKRLNLGILG